MSEIRRVNTGDAPRNVYHAGDAPRTVNTGRTVKTGSALNQDEYEAARRRAQQLAAKGYDLYYWESSSTAELDFVLQKGNQIVGVEVKKGEHVRSRSLSVFVDSYKPAYSVRLSLKNFGEKDGLKSVPLYAAFCV